MSYRVLLADVVPTTTDEDGNEHVLSGVRVLRETDDGVYLHVVRGVEVRGATEVGEANDADSFRRLPSEHRAAILHAKVYRDRTGGFRQDIEDKVGIVEKRVPQSGKASKDPADPETAKKALDEARRRAADPDSGVRALRVPMGTVTDDDVVDEDLLSPHVWAR